jgi:hyperosmotically inducible periplasmic protein
MSHIMSLRFQTLLILVLAVPLALALAGCGRTVGETIDDATIATRVKTALLNDPDVGGLAISVDAFKGVVTLSGRVRSEDEQRKAMDIARRVGGVADVKSTLQVIPDGPES